jgi:hypothetical protein
MANYDSNNPRLRERVIDELRRWAETHPRRREVVIATMTMDRESARRDEGGQMFDPRDFVEQVVERTAYGQSFLEYLVRQANLHEVEPEEFIRRAVRANGLS